MDFGTQHLKMTSSLNLRQEDWAHGNCFLNAHYSSNCLCTFIGEQMNEIKPLLLKTSPTQETKLIQ